MNTGMPNTTIQGWPWRALDPDFDAAVLAMAKAVLPDGYDVSDIAPSTFEELILHLDNGGRMIVWSGGSGTTIFGSPEVTFAFRAWHDFEHWCGRYPFTLAGEAAATTAQLKRLQRMFGNHPREREWRAYMLEEVIGQALYAEINDTFPNNQRLFAKKFLEAMEPQAEIPAAAKTSFGKG